MDLEKLWKEEPGQLDSHPLWKPFQTWCKAEFGIGGLEVPSPYFAAFLEGTRAITALEGSNALLIVDRETLDRGYWRTEPGGRILDGTPQPPNVFNVPYTVIRPIANGRFLVIMSDAEMERFSSTPPPVKQ